MNHTPGPWHLDGIAKADSSHVISGPTQKWIAAALDFNKFDRDAEVEANARLIAAAPELLNALRRIVLWERHDSDFLTSLADDSASSGENPSSVIWQQRLMENAEAAIAKAEGK